MNYQNHLSNDKKLGGEKHSDTKTNTEFFLLENADHHAILSVHFFKSGTKTGSNLLCKSGTQ
jgi:hypothetical protein